MKTRIFIVVSLVSAFLLIAPFVIGQGEGEKKPTEKKAKDIHDELRELKKGLTDAVVNKDTEKQLIFVTKDIVVTWQNGDVVKGHKGLKEFLDKGKEVRCFKDTKKENCRIRPT